MDHKDVNRLIEAINGIKGWLIVIWIALLGIMAFTAANANAESAIVSFDDLIFTDIADLDAQVDSVLAICDSAMTKARVDSLVAEGWDVYNPVTCRRFAGLTVYDNAGMRPGYYQVGTARLWWWEVSE